MNLLRLIDYYIREKKVLHVRQHSYSLTMCGNSYGGFMVALDELNNESVVYSFGIGEDLSFSEDIMDTINCSIFAFDPTPKSIRYIEKHKLYTNLRFKFYSDALSDYDGITQFHLPLNDDYVSGSIENWDGVKEETIDVRVRSLQTIMTDLGHEEIDLLKMDIEGTEFRVVEDIVNKNIPVKQICLEFHDRFFENGIDKLESMMRQLRMNNYELIYSDKKNCTITLIRTY